MAKSIAKDYRAQIESLNEEERSEMQDLLTDLSQVGAYFKPIQVGATHYRALKVRLRLRVFEKLVEWGHLEEWNKSNKKTVYHKKDEKGLEKLKKSTRQLNI